MKRLFKFEAVLLAGLALLLTSPATVQAGSFTTDFNSGLPANTAVFGNSRILGTGGFTNSGYLQLTTNAASQNGGFVITNDLDAGTPVVSFVARFKALIGGGNAADGISFNFAQDLPLGTISEDGAGTGLSVEFDTFANTAVPGDEIGIDLHINGSIAATFPFGGLRQNTFVDVYVSLNPDNTVNVIYDGTQVYTNQDASFLNSGAPITGGLFGFGARTGGAKRQPIH